MKERLILIDFSKGSSELTKVIDKKLDEFDDHPSIYYTGNIFRYFRNFKRVNRSDHGRGANDFKNILEYEGVNCYIPSGNACFLKCKNFFQERL